MAQHTNEHLTIAQLSAYLDQALASDEVAQCATHLQTCQSCQSMLTDLRLTSALLRRIPQVEVPRSFVLPTNLVVLPTTPASAARPMLHPSFVKRSLRTLSTLAAVVGLIFILAGVLTTFSHNGATNTATTAAPSTYTTHSPILGSSTASNVLTPLATATVSKHVQPPVLTHTPDQTPTPQPTASPSSGQVPTLNPDNNAQQSGLPFVLDPSQPADRLSIGAILLLLGILGILWTRHIQRASKS